MNRIRRELLQPLPGVASQVRQTSFRHFTVFMNSLPTNKKVTKYYPSHFMFSTWLSSGTFGCIQGFYKGVLYFRLSHISSAFTWCTLIWQHRKCIANTSVPLAKVYRIVIFGVLSFAEFSRAFERNEKLS